MRRGVERLGVPAATVASLALWAGAALAPPAAAEVLSAEDHVKRVAPAVVTVRAVNTARIALGQESRSVEIDLELVGVVLDPSGLVLVNNSGFGDDDSPLVRQLSKSIGGASISLEIARIRVQFAGETAERDAVLVVRDPKNDLAWIQVLGTADGPPLASIDLAVGHEPWIGQRVVGVSRRAARFDHAPVVARSYVAARITTPRLLWSLGGDVGDPGHLVFDLEGRPVGALVVHGSADEEELDILLLPIDVVRKSRDAALAKAAEVRAGR